MSCGSVSSCNIYINLSMFIKQNFNLFEKSGIGPVFRDRKFHVPLLIKLVRDMRIVSKIKVKMYSECVNLYMPNNSALSTDGQICIDTVRGPYFHWLKR